MLVEVADTSLDEDRGWKARLYARAGIGCYWIVNLVDRWVEVYTDPTGPDPAPGYRQRRTCRAGEMVEVRVGEGGGAIAVADLLP